MKQADLMKIGIGMLLLAGLAAAGCGFRDTTGPSPDVADEPAMTEPEPLEALVEPLSEPAPAP